MLGLTSSFLLPLFALSFLYGSYLGQQLTYVPANNLTATQSGGNLDPAQLTSSDRDQIKNAKRLIRGSGGHDYSGAYQLLSAYKGNKAKLDNICNNFSDISSTLVCLKKISQDNPTFRTEMCDKLAAKLTASEYNQILAPAELTTFVAEHKQEYLKGIPQAIY